MVATGGKGAKSMAIGAALQCAEAASLGMPFEVWKTHQGRFRELNAWQSLRTVVGERGVSGLWRGTGAKMVESASKGAVLLYSKEVLLDAARTMGLGPTAAGLLAGAGGGVCQVSVMGPCTYVVTAAVVGAKERGVTQIVRETWAKEGIRGFYPGGSAIAFRQATNWASRQGFTEFVRTRVRRYRHPEDPEGAKLTVGEEVASGVMGGFLASWNHPFEVARIEMQARASSGQERLSMVQTMRAVVAEHGVGGLFKGIVPRIGLGIWQTLFMVTGAKLILRRD